MDGKNNSFQGLIVLNSKNYSDWKITMEDFIIGRDLYKPIDRSEILTGVVGSVWIILHRKVVTTIRQFVDVSLLQRVVNDMNAYEMCISLLACMSRKMPLPRHS